MRYRAGLWLYYYHYYYYINVKNYFSLKHGVYRPDSTYKTAKMIYQNYLHWAEAVSCSVKGKEISMAYIPVFDRRMHSGM